MPDIASSFVAPIINCQESQNAGSCLLIAKLPDCAVEPNILTLTVDVAAAAGDEEISLTVTSAVDTDGNPVTPLDAEYSLRKDAVISFDDGAGGFVEAKVVTATMISSAATTVVPVAELEAAIAAAATAEIFQNVEEITDATDLPINSDSQDDDRKVLKNGLQSSKVKTDISANVALQMITNPENKAQFNILFEASQTTEDIYVIVVKSSGYFVAGRSKVMGYSITGQINSLERVSTTLDMQAPYGLGFLTQDPMIQPDASKRTLLARLARLAGLPAIVQ